MNNTHSSFQSPPLIGSWARHLTPNCSSGAAQWSAVQDCSCTGHRPVYDRLWRERGYSVSLPLIKILICNLIRKSFIHLNTLAFCRRLKLTDVFRITLPMALCYGVFQEKKKRQKKKKLPLYLHGPSNHQGLFPFEIIFQLLNLELTHPTCDPFLTSNSSCRHT